MRKYECRFADTKHYGEDWREIEAPTPSMAAEKFAEDYDRRGDYDIVRLGSSDGPVEIKCSDGSIIKYDIIAEIVPRYYARAAKTRVTRAT